jgi:hypothetical protein
LFLKFHPIVQSSNLILSIEPYPNKNWINYTNFPILY